MRRRSDTGGRFATIGHVVGTAGRSCERLGAMHLRRPAVDAVCLARFFARSVVGRTGGRGSVQVGGAALSSDGCLVAAGPCVGAVETFALSGEPGLEPAQGGLGSGE